MRLIILFGLLIALGSCKSKKNANCDAYGNLNFDYITTDALYLEEQIHLEEVSSWASPEKYIMVNRIEVKTDRK
jgi:hypothetical protein